MWSHTTHIEHIVVKLSGKLNKLLSGIVLFRSAMFVLHKQQRHQHQRFNLILFYFSLISFFSSNFPQKCFIFYGSENNETVLSRRRISMKLLLKLLQRKAPHFKFEIAKRNLTRKKKHEKLWKLGFVFF